MYVAALPPAGEIWNNMRDTTQGQSSSLRLRTLKRKTALCSTGHFLDMREASEEAPEGSAMPMS